MRKKWKDEIKRQGEIIDFLMQYDKKDIVLVRKVDPYVFSETIYAKFIYENKVKKIRIRSSFRCGSFGILDEKDEFFIVKEIVLCGENRYYKITKNAGEVVDITDIYKESEGQTYKNISVELDLESWEV